MATMRICMFFVLVTGCVGIDSLRFLVLGDWGGLPYFPYRTSIEVGTAKQMENITKLYGTTFNLALGDNFYFDGVKDVHDSRFLKTFDMVFSYTSLYDDWYLVAGNHDHNGNVSAQIAYSDVSKRWNFKDYYYKLSFPISGGKKTVDILMLDTVLLCGNTKDDVVGDQPAGPEDIQASQTQWEWIHETLEASKADYLLVAGHFPVYSIAEHGPTDCLVQQLNPLLLKYNCTAYFSGHDHNLQHLYTPGDKDKPFMNYFVSGAANFADTSNAHADSVPKGSSKFFWAKESQHGGFAFVEATDDNMTVVFIDGAGNDLYTHHLYPR